MMKYFLIFFYCCFFFPSAFAQICEGSFSESTHEVDEFLLRRADEKLQRDLKDIRESPQEPLLKAQGFRSSYYAGVDQAREFKRVQEYLEEIKAEEHTYIPYFADQVEKIISDFERGFREQYPVNDPFYSSFVRDRLRSLEVLKKSAREKIESQKVTYKWWVNFNLDLVLLSEDIFPTNPLQVSASNMKLKFKRVAAKFPKHIMFFTTNELGVMAFNRMGETSYLIGVSGKNQTVDGRFLPPSAFFAHDIGHIPFLDNGMYVPIYTPNFLRGKEGEIVNRLNNISNKSDREKAEFVLFMSWHEKNAFKVFSENDESQKKNKENLLDTIFFNDIMYEDILPENLLESVKMKDAVQAGQFVDSAMDVFTENFSDLFKSSL